MISSLKKLLLTGSIGILSISSAYAKHYKIYVLTGQSNSLGCTTANKNDKKAATPPKDRNDKNIPFFWANRSTRGGDGPSTLIGTSDGKITFLKEQQGEGRNKTFWGPEVGFGREMIKQKEQDFLIIKASRGGGGNGFWVKDQQMYTHVVQTVKACTDLLDKKKDTYEIVGLLFVQGESNKAREAKIAGLRFRDLLDQLRVDLPKASNMQGYIGGIAAAGGARDLTRTQQKEMAEKNEDIAYFTNMDLTKHLYDKLHFDTEAKLEIGKRFALAIRKREAELAEKSDVKK